MAFQNSHFSLAYDRPSITMISHPEIPFDQKSMPGHRQYFETLCRITDLALEILRGRVTSVNLHRQYHEICEYQRRTQRILDEGVPHLRVRSQCMTFAERIENAELQLHSSYVISVLCRSSLDATAWRQGDPEQWAAVQETLIESLISTIDAYVTLHSIDERCSRAWISLQRAIASAFLLVSTEWGQLHPRTWDLIGQLESVLTDHVRGSSGSFKGSKTLTTANHLTSSIHGLQKVSKASRAKAPVPAGQHQTIVVSPISEDIVSSRASTSTTRNAMPPGGLVPAVNAAPVNAQPAMLHRGSADSGTNPYSRSRSSSHSDFDMHHMLGSVSEVMLFPPVFGDKP